MLAGLGVEKGLFSLLEGLTDVEVGLSKTDALRACYL